MIPRKPTMTTTESEVELSVSGYWNPRREGNRPNIRLRRDSRRTGALGRRDGDDVRI